MKKFLFAVVLAVSSPAFAADLNVGLQALSSGDYRTAVTNLQPLALEGNAEAAYRMCGLNYLGQGVGKNDAEAVHYCSIAANKGHVDAQYNLALFYQNGNGTHQDLAEATRWYSQAAAAGHSDAKFNLAQIQTTAIAPTATTGAPIAAAAAPAVATAPIVAPNGPATWLPAGTPILQVEEIIAKNDAAALAAAPRYVPQPVMMASAPQPVAVAAPTPPPIPPLPPVPPVVQNAAAAKPPVAAENSFDMNKYCLIAAQRGNPDPKCGKEYSEFLPKEPAAPVAVPAPVSTAAPVAKAAPVVPTPQKTVDAQAKPAGFLDAPKAASSAISQQASAPTAVAATKAPAVVAATTATTAQAIVPDASAQPKTKHQNLDWYVEQANAGNPVAQNNLGVMHRRGTNGADKDSAKALKWFEQSASRGDTNGMLNLASMFKEGEGTKKNLELSYAWYNLAADRLPMNEVKIQATANVQQLAKQLNNQQIGNALQYVSKLDETIPRAD